MVEAFDINDRANDVYEHNFGHRPYQVCFSRKNNVHSWFCFGKLDSGLKL